MSCRRKNSLHNYQYDHNGNITQLLDLIDSTKSYHTTTYDGLDRLLSAKGNFRPDSLRLTYAKNGNRLTKQVGSSTNTTSYFFSSNRLDSTRGVEGVNYSYNANGSVTVDSNLTGTLHSSLSIRQIRADSQDYRSGRRN
ncbi:MAG: hypothetical protein L0Y74_11540 [candidate division Zixibacteria bacterium]|nr:hypothetical protein [candidate division Zixibacteria bacterium]